VFALANVGIVINGASWRTPPHLRGHPRRAAGVRWSGKPVAVVGVSTGCSLGSPVVDCVRRSVGGRWSGSGTIAGIGFTVSLLIAPGFHGEQLDEAKLGAIVGGVVARC